MPSKLLFSAARIFKHLTLFAVAGVFMGAIVGLISGVLAGVALSCLAVLFNGEIVRQPIQFLCALSCLAVLFNVYNSPITDHSLKTLLLNGYFGGYFGGYIGIITGAASGLVAWAIASVMQWRRDGILHILHQTMRGGLRASLIATAAGALNGAAIDVTLRSSGYCDISGLCSPAQPFSSAFKAALTPISGGFFFGSILGCAVGILLGAIWGARPEENCLNAPLHRLPDMMKSQWRHFIGK